MQHIYQQRGANLVEFSFVDMHTHLSSGLALHLVVIAGHTLAVSFVLDSCANAIRRRLQLQFCRSTLGSIGQHYSVAKLLRRVRDEPIATALVNGTTSPTASLQLRTRFVDTVHRSTPTDYVRAAHYKPLLRDGLDAAKALQLHHQLSISSNQLCSCRAGRLYQDEERRTCPGRSRRRCEPCCFHWCRQSCAAPSVYDEHVG